MTENEHFQKGLDEVAELQRKLKTGSIETGTVDKNAVDEAESKRTVIKDTIGGHGQPAFQLVDGDDTVAVSKTGKARMDAELIAEKPKQNRIESQTTNEKRIPKDGETISLSQLMSDYKTPFIGAYEHSKKLKPGDQGKSPTLEMIVDRLKNCPCANRISIRFDSKADHPEYSNAD